MSKLILAAILLAAFLLRLTGLANHPAGFTPDEASFGYDAYSLLKTGQDQWGASWPLSFKSFGDYKLPLYTYLTLPSIAAFGLSEFAVRLPNALLGSMAILVLYLLCLEIFKDKHTKKENERMALIASFLLAISPWHIALSRGAFEANLTTFFLPLGIYLFLLGLKKHKWLIAAAFFFGINLFTYHSARLLTPLIVLFLVIHFRRKISLNKVLILSTLIFVLFGAIAGLTMLQGGAQRAGSAAIYNPTGGWGNVGELQYDSVKAGENPFIARIFHNKVTYTLQLFTANYLSYFSPQFLFTQGPAEATYGMAPGHGVLYLYEAIFLLMFIYIVLTKKVTNLGWLLAWIILAPIPAALAKGPGLAANRAAIMMPAIQIISAIGAYYLYLEARRVFNSKVVISLFIAIATVAFLFSAENYFAIQRSRFAQDMIFGAREVVTAIKELETPGDQVVITKNLSEAHIYVAFYKKMDPIIYQQYSKEWNFDKRGLTWVDQLPEYKLENYLFSSNINIPSSIVVTSPPDNPQGVCTSDVVKKIYYPNGKEAFYIRYNSNSKSHGC